MTNYPASLTLGLLAIAATAPTASSQYRWESNEALGVKFMVHKKLESIPMRLGSGDPHQRARFEPKNEGDYIYTKYGKAPWQLHAYEFHPQGLAATTGVDTKPGKPENVEEARKLAEAQLRAARVAKNFEEFVKEKDANRSKRKFFVEGKTVKGGHKRPGCVLWEYSDGRGVRDSRGKTFELRIYRVAAAYEIDQRQIALVVSIPVKRGPKADKKYLGYAKKMVTSLRLLKEGGDLADAGDDERDEFAKTERQKEQLAALKKNIAGLDNWNYFTTPNFIICYSWDKPHKRAKSKAFAERISERLEEIRSKFVEYFPPHEKQKKNYSVIRVCSDYDEFLKYGNMPTGVVGWFSPSSKELCVFYDADRRFGDENYIIGVCYHEAWHQYADGYWPSTNLHRWFDEGLAEYFNSWRLRGRRWKIEYLRGRFDAIRRQINEKTFIPGREIVTWYKPKFYGPRAPDHYAQAYAMVDMLLRGHEKLGRKWDQSWDQIMPTYHKVALETHDSKKAVEAAFQGVDFEKFDAAWRAWVKDGYIKKM